VKTHFKFKCFIVWASSLNTQSAQPSLNRIKRKDVTVGTLQPSWIPS